MPKIGELYAAYAASNEVIAVKKAAVDAANAEFDDSQAEGNAKKKEFVDGITARPVPTKLIVLFDADGVPFVVVPDSSPDGFRVEYADGEDTEIDGPPEPVDALPLTKAAAASVPKPAPKPDAKPDAKPKPDPFGKGV